ncbi:MAG: 50S ribosomal protein L10 [Bacillota bacterium]
MDVLTRQRKEEMVEELTGMLKTAKTVFIADYKGITVARVSDLRNRLRAVNSTIRVAKNTLVKIAAKNAGIEGMDQFLEGPVALAVVYGEPAVSAKILSGFIREFKILEIKGGILEGKVLSGDDVKTLAELPPYEVLVAKVVGGLKSPLYGLVNVMNGPLRNLVYVLEAVREKQAKAS